MIKSEDIKYYVESILRQKDDNPWSCTDWEIAIKVFDCVKRVVPNAEMINISQSHYIVLNENAKAILQKQLLANLNSLEVYTQRMRSDYDNCFA